MMVGISGTLGTELASSLVLQGQGGGKLHGGEMGGDRRDRSNKDEIKWGNWIYFWVNTPHGMEN